MLTPANFRCRRCGKCCITYTVKLSGKDIINIESLGLKLEEFADLDDFDKKFGRFALKRKEDKCIFLAKKGNTFFCKIYRERPQICRDYPFNEQKEIETCTPVPEFRKV